MNKHLSTQELNSKLPYITDSPKDKGELKMIVIRPQTNQRIELDSCNLSYESGVHGDSWAKGCWLVQEDGSPHPDVQVCIMNTRAIEIIAVDKTRWALAEDNLFIDMDLSKANLTPGQQLQLGETVLEITPEPHKGCLKFADRFGKDASRFVNDKQGRELRLRGIYAKVIKPGEIRIGDVFTKLS